MANIRSNNYRKLDCKLINDLYMDFMISKDEIMLPEFNINKSAAMFDFKNITSKQIVSNISWDKAVSSNTIIKNIGFTGVDNGFITYEKDKISNDEFLEIFTNSKFDLSTYSDKFFMTEVSGNTSNIKYNIEKHGAYASFKGGFYQGFFKIENDNYKTLPTEIENEWNFNFTINNQNYKVEPNTLNYFYPNNKGIFFYIGTRSENKFWELYKNNITNEPVEPEINGVVDEQYYEDTPCEHNDCYCNSYFENSGYLKEQISLKNIDILDKKGFNIKEKGFYEIKTDNKFIFFNQTKDGYNYKNWNGETFTITGKTDNPNVNYFPYLNQTTSGYTYKNIYKLTEKYSYVFDVFKSIENNALALKLNDNGSISYRYLSYDNEIIEETSLPNIIKQNTWVNIHLKIVNKPNSHSDCTNNKNGSMQLFIYVNGKLKLVSKILPKLSLKPLNESPEKQEGVPYNISIGGGTQGLAERVLLNYYDTSKYVLPIEQNFAGTFMGDIKSFCFIPEKIDFNDITKIDDYFY